MTCLTSAYAAPVHYCAGPRAQDYESLETNTHAAENRCADSRRRAGVDRTRNRYHVRTHFGYVRPRVCPPNSVLVAGWFAGAAAAMALFEPDREDYRSGAY